LHDFDEVDDDALTPEQLAERTAALARTVRETQQNRCFGCENALCGHEALLNVVLGSKHQPRCHTCLGEEHGEAPDALVERALQWIRRRQCFLHVWRDAGQQEHGARDDRPDCLFAAARQGDDEQAANATRPDAHDPNDDVVASHEHDAGDQGCGDLVLELRNVLRELAPGDVLHVRATDPAAPIDLPAWCGLTGHTMLRHDHPEYWIRRRTDR